jgi:hypothetical protein
MAHSREEFHLTLMGGDRSANFTAGELLCPTHFLPDTGNGSLTIFFNIQEEEKTKRIAK